MPVPCAVLLLAHARPSAVADAYSFNDQGVGENLRDDGFCILAGPLLKPEFVRTDAPRSKWAVPGNHVRAVAPCCRLLLFAHSLPRQMWFPDDGRDDEMPRFSAGMMFGKLWYGSHDKLGEWAPMVFIEPLAQES